MSKPPLLQERQSYTFPSYFEMPDEPDEILAELGYALVRAQLSLPKTQDFSEEEFIIICLPSC